MHMLPISRSSGRASFKLLSWTAFASVLTLSTCIKAEIACPCATPDLCKPIRTQHEKEVIIPKTQLLDFAHSLTDM
eukprot:jgi/Botrbrau1/2311/Bobra.101_2s0131.1